MITEEQYNEAKKLFIQYETEQLNLLRANISKLTTTNIPKEEWGVHRTHCCFEHGCKYCYDDCPISIGLIKQDFPCETCDEEHYEYDRSKHFN